MKRDIYEKRLVHGATSLRRHSCCPLRAGCMKRDLCIYGKRRICIWKETCLWSKRSQKAFLLPVRARLYERHIMWIHIWAGVLWMVDRSSVLQWFAACCSGVWLLCCEWSTGAGCCSVLIHCNTGCCSVLIHCNTGQKAFLRATHYNTAERNGRTRHGLTAAHCHTLRYTVIQCDTLRHTATHCITLHHTATHCITLQLTATHCITLQQTATQGLDKRQNPLWTHCSTLNTLHTLQHTASHCNTPQHTTIQRLDKRQNQVLIYCSKLQHTATHYNTLHHTTWHCNTGAGQTAEPDTDANSICQLCCRAALERLFQVCCSIAVCCRVLQCVAVRCRALPCVAVRCSALQCAAVCCNVVKCVAVCCTHVACVNYVVEPVYKSFFTSFSDDSPPHSPLILHAFSTHFPLFPHPFSTHSPLIPHSFLTHSPLILHAHNLKTRCKCTT